MIKKIEGSQKLLANIQGYKQSTTDAYRSDIIDSKTYASMLIHINQVQSKIKEYTLKQEQQYRREGGAFYDPTQEKKAQLYTK